MTVFISPVPFQYLPNPNNTGAPASGFRIFTYVAGTSTKQATWTDSTQTVQNPNPLYLDANGFLAVSSGSGFWLDPTLTYKIVFAAPGSDDPPSSPIRSMDNVSGTSTLPFFGGVDSGTANAYVLSFPASFPALVNGIVIYWIPANTNTGGSTLTVNALGTKAILNPDGSVLLAGQITAGQPVQVIYYNGGWVLINGTFIGGPLTVKGNVSFGSAGNNAATVYGTTAATQVDISADYGTFTGTLSGMTTTTTGTFNWVRMGPIACIYLTAASGITGTSNSNALQLTGIPTFLNPINPTYQSCFNIIDNGTDYAGFGFFSSGAIVFGRLTVSTTHITPPTAAFTASGTKGLDTEWSFMYPLH